MNKKLFFVVIAILFAITARSQSALSSSLVGKLLFATTQKTKVVKSVDEANKAMNLGIKDLLVITLIEDSINVRIRVIVLPDGRLCRIENDGNQRFYFISQYYDESKKNPEKLVECFINKNGKVTEIEAKYAVDPNGKNGFVIDDQIIKEMEKSKAVFEYNDAPFLSDKDPLVVRYQRIVDETLKLF
ncbi:MAG TPA: hypothetical protein PLP73_01650 [Candidatus Absconditabacterales bacterium]|nr:hypothetical protein [Candidatus Absconditabacterales bacterium]HRU50125.1 hypothetical protein [Candidatus Absconditabacterales bacterium]